MTVDLSGEEIGLIQEALYTKILRLKDGCKNFNDNKDIFKYELLSDKFELIQEYLEQNEE